MTNSYPHGSSGGLPITSPTSNPWLSGSGPAMYRRQSYAAAAAGATANPQHHNTRFGAPSHFATGNMGSLGVGTDYRERMNRGDGNMFGSAAAAASAAYSAGGRNWGNQQLPSYASQFGHLEGLGFLGEHHGPSFFTPSYLRYSRHAERLEEAHRAEVQAQREQAQQPRRQSNPSLSTSSSSVNLNKMGQTHHRGIVAHDVIERAPPPLMDSRTLAPLPTRWSDVDKAVGLDVVAGGLEVKFSGPAKSNDEAAAVRSDHPMPRAAGIFYFEVMMMSKGKEGLIGVGFSSKKVALNRVPGWEPASYAYHGDDGFSFCCTSSGQPYGPKFAAQDVIGCGVNFRTNTAFFTKNGVELGTAFKELTSEPIYPSVGLKKPGEHIQANFGQWPFVFDIDGYAERERMLVQSQIAQAPIASLAPKGEKALINELIAQYLADDGYVETTRAFMKEVRAEMEPLSNGRTSLNVLDPSEDIDAINRQKIRSAILEGDIDKALKHTQAYYPSVLRDNENIYFALRRRKFIEIAKKLADTISTIKAKTNSKSSKSNTNGFSSKLPPPPSFNDDYEVFDHDMEVDDQSPVSETFHPTNEQWDDPMDSSRSESIEDLTTRKLAIEQEMMDYGMELNAEFKDDPRNEVRKALHECFALFAYSDPRESESGLRGLLEVGERVGVAEEVNGAILVSLGKSSAAPLERLVQQTDVLLDMISEDGGAGSLVNLKKDVLR